MGSTGRRTTLVVVVACLPALLLGSLPTPGMGRLGALERIADPGREWFGSDDAGSSRLLQITAPLQVSLAPGLSTPIAVHFKNRRAQSMTVARVKVKIKRIAAPHADALHPCTKQDFRIQQMRKRTKIRIPGRRSTNLAALGVPVRKWPVITMLNRPVNQDGCKEAKLTLRFRASRLVRR